MASSGAHVLVYPYVSSGHIIPLLDLTHRLLSRGLTVTFLITPKNLPLLDPLLAAHGSSIKPLVLHPPDLSNLPRTGLISMIRCMKESFYGQIVDWFKSHPSPPVAIISDFFLGWTNKLASELGIKRVVFSPSGAFGLSISSHLWRERPEVPDDLNSVVTFPKIPNSPSYPWWQIPSHYRAGKGGDPDWDLLAENTLGNLASWGAVFNTFTELERVYLDHLRKEFWHDRVWAIGPVLPPEDDAEELSHRGGSSAVPCHDVITWLDSHPENSVVYVCFGSREVLTGRQLQALTEGLELSGVRFILSVRPADGGGVNGDVGVMPDGFKERVGQRGFVIKGWAPQVAILRHRAVGAFLTHCGWNSVMEGLSAGVVMLTWPMGADQFTNAKLLVDQLGVGIRVGEGSVNIPEPAQLARQVAKSLEESRPERVRAQELSRAAREATAMGGSSDGDLDQFVEQVGGLITGGDN